MSGKTMVYLLLQFLGLSLAVASVQTPLGEDCVDCYKSFRHENSNHVITIKSQNDTICDARTKQYTGWLSVGTMHLFFWYFDMSEKSPHNDSLTLWLTGGPGGSSMIGLFQELGPCLIADEGRSTRYNPYGWDKATSLLFVDQPAGVGFSYIDDEYTPVTDNSFTSAIDMTIFLQMFVSQVFPEKAEVPFHISGESYAGHYIPALGVEILKQNAFYPNHPQVPLKSVMIGDGLFYLPDTTFGYWDTLCTTKVGMDKPVFNETICDIMAENAPRCLELYQVCVEHPDPTLCDVAYQVCWNGVMKFYDEQSARKGGRNPFDITHTCELEELCYKESQYIEDYLNSAKVWKALDVPPALKNFSTISWEVASAFTPEDFLANMLPQVQGLLANNIDVLIYQGNLDLACNTAGNLLWANKLPWKGQAEFISRSLVPWFYEVDGKEKEAGSFKEVAVRMGESSTKVRFALVTVDRAGHMVPQDQPGAALAMVNRWISGKSFGGGGKRSADNHGDL